MKPITKKKMSDTTVGRSCIRMEVFTKDEIPPMAEGGAAAVHQCSDFYFAKVLNCVGEERFTMAAFDFKNKVWLFSSPGKKELIEYYKPVS